MRRSKKDRSVFQFMRTNLDAEHSSSRERRSNSDGVYIDDDSMENVNSYWNLANRELDEMKDIDSAGNLCTDISRQKRMHIITFRDPHYKDKGNNHWINQNISNRKEEELQKQLQKQIINQKIMQTTCKPDSIENIRHIAMSKSVIRKSFDEEFKDDIDNAVLSGFSDSSFEENQKGYTEKIPEKITEMQKISYLEQPENRDIKPRRMSFLPYPVDVTGIKNTPQNEKLSCRKDLSFKFKQSSLMASMDLTPKTNQDLPIKRKRGRPSKKSKSLESSMWEDKKEAEPESHLEKTTCIPYTKHIEIGSLLKIKETMLGKITIMMRKRKKLMQDRIYYILKGSLLVSDVKYPTLEEQSYTYRNSEYKGTLLKSGAVIHRDSPISVYNIGMYECVLLFVEVN